MDKRIIKYLKENYYQIAVLTSLLSALAVISYTVILHDVSTSFKIYMNTAEAFLNGTDPYNSTIGNLADKDLNYVYPPITILPFIPVLLLSKTIGKLTTHYLIYSTVIAISGYLVYRADDTKDILYLSAIILGGFASTYWSLLKGNADVLSFLIIALLIYGIEKNRKNIVSGIAGALSTFKLLPLAPIGLFLFKKGTWKEKLKPIITGLTGFTGVIAASWIIFPELSKSFQKQFIEKKGGSGLPEGWANSPPGGESMMHLIGDFYTFKSQPEVFGGIFILWILLVFAIMLVYYVNNEDFSNRLSFGVISFLLVFPKELSPSTLALGVPALYFLSKDYNKNKKILTLVITVILPTTTIIARGKILPLPNTPLYNTLTSLIMHSIKISLLGFWTIEITDKKLEIPTTKELIDLLRS